MDSHYEISPIGSRSPFSVAVMKYPRQAIYEQKRSLFILVLYAEGPNTVVPAL